MALRSMTGYGSREGESVGISWCWQLRAVNGRGLDIRCRLPGLVDLFESTFRKKIQSRLTRGNILASLELRRESGDRAVTVNRTLLEELADLAAELGHKAGVEAPGADGLLALRGVLESADSALAEEDRQPLLTALSDGLDGALDDLIADRTREGAALEKALASQIDELEAQLAEARRTDDAKLETIRARFAKRIDELLEPDRNLDRDRLEQEITMAALKADIREEIDRLEAHLGRARALFAEDRATGRKLDFLAQEMGRETNTLSSKAASSGLTDVALSMKVIVDQFKEQVQNIE